MRHSIQIAVFFLLIASASVLGQSAKEEKLLLKLLAHPELAQGEMAGMLNSYSG